MTNPAQPSQQVPSGMAVLTPADALRNLVNAIGGGKKVCGHPFDCSCAFNDARAVLAAAMPGQVEAKPVPLNEIGMILHEVMEDAVANGANSISMPDEYVTVAHFLSFPDEYALKSASEPLTSTTERSA